MNMVRQANMINRISGNAANAVDDYTNQRNFDAKEEYNKQQLAILKAMYSNNNGIVNRADSDILKMLNN